MMTTMTCIFQFTYINICVPFHIYIDFKYLCDSQVRDDLFRLADDIGDDDYDTYIKHRQSGASGVLQCVAECCRVLQCVSVCFSVLHMQCVAHTLSCNVLRRLKRVHQASSSGCIRCVVVR